MLDSPPIKFVLPSGLVRQILEAENIKRQFVKLVEDKLYDPDNAEHLALSLRAEQLETKELIELF